MEFPSSDFFTRLNQKISMLKLRYPNLSFESCAEPRLKETNQIGCISNMDLERMGLPLQDERFRKKSEERLWMFGRKDGIAVLLSMADRIQLLLWLFVLLLENKKRQGWVIPSLVLFFLRSCLSFFCCFCFVLC